MKIEYAPISSSNQIPAENLLGFGTVFADRMFSQKYTQGTGWGEAKIGPYQPITLYPAAAVLHYGQEIFEGAKAYRRPDGQINLFRIRENLRRFNSSAKRMAMPVVGEAEHLEALLQLIQLEHAWVPHQVGTALYIRPFMFATDSILGVRASKTYLHFIILSPVGAYFPAGFNTISVYVSDTYRRAVKGGVGDVKTGGNYAASLLVAEEAQRLGYAQVLWLDAISGKYIEEVGAMNICFVYEGKRVVTPPLTGSILPGITRDSILTLGRDLKYEMVEEQVDITQVLADIESNKITEVFGCGTAAVIAPIGKLGFRGKEWIVSNNQVGPVSRHLYEELTGIQRGEIQDRFGWTQKVDVKENS